MLATLLCALYVEIKTMDILLDAMEFTYLNSNIHNNYFTTRITIFSTFSEALWEKTHDYTDIERYYTRCDAENCICPKGTTFSNIKWTIQLCSCCGSYGLHKLCRPKSERENYIICDVCLKVVKTSEHVDDSPIQSQHARDSPKHENEPQSINHHVTNLTELPHQNIKQNLSNNAKLEDDVVMIIDLTQEDDEVNILEGNIQSECEVSETLEEKRRREKAERPIRNEMRDFRISLWFRDCNRHQTNEQTQ